jgi:chaperonin GroEL
MREETQDMMQHKAEMVDDMIKAGIIDPVKVERAWRAARGVRGRPYLLTSEAAIADAPETEKPAMPDMGGMGGGMY